MSLGLAGAFSRKACIAKLMVQRGVNDSNGFFLKRPVEIRRIYVKGAQARRNLAEGDGRIDIMAAGEAGA